MESIQDLVISDIDPRQADVIALIQARKNYGIAKHGQPLTIKNQKKDPMDAAINKLADAMVYLRQVIVLEGENPSIETRYAYKSTEYQLQLLLELKKKIPQSDDRQKRIIALQDSVSGVKNAMP